MAQLGDAAQPLQHRMRQLQELILGRAAGERGAQHQVHLQHGQRAAQRKQLRTHHAFFGLELTLQLRDHVRVRLGDRLLHTLAERAQRALLRLETVAQLVQLGLERDHAVANAGLQLANRIHRALHLLRGLLPGVLDVHAVDPRVCGRVAEASGAKHAFGALAVHYVLLAVGRTATLSVLGAFAHVQHFMGGEHLCAMRVFPAVGAERLSCKFFFFF